MNRRWCDNFNGNLLKVNKVYRNLLTVSCFPGIRWNPCFLWCRETALWSTNLWNLFHYRRRTAKFKLTRCALRTVWVEKFLARMQNRFFHASNRSIIIMNRLKVQWHRWYSTAIGRSGVAVSHLQLHSYRAVHRDDWQKFTMSANLQWLITVFLRDPPRPSGHTQAHLYVLYKFCSHISRLLQVRISFSEFLPNFVKYCRYSYVLMSFLKNWRFLAQEKQYTV